MIRLLGLAAPVLVVSPTAVAQLVINEILQNPPGLGDVDAQWEFIELYGSPKLDLTGYAIALVIDEASLCGRVEVAAVFDLSGWVTDSNGYFILASVSGPEPTGVATHLKLNPDFRPFEPESPSNIRISGGASFEATFVASRRQLELAHLPNDGASTWMLLRRRPDMSANGEQTWAAGMLCDNDYNGEIDSGSETEACLPTINFGPYQVVDELAWRGSGRELTYTTSPESVLHDTPGFTPDAVSRLRYFPSNPTTGYRTDDRRDQFGHHVGFDIVRTTIAEESFVYGELDPAQFPQMLVYLDGFDLQGWYQTKAPTDPGSDAFVGNCDPEPDTIPFPTPCLPSTDGAWHMTDLPIVDFPLTPGAPNDHPRDARLRQFRYVPGDVDFDGVVTAADKALLESRIGASLDDQIRIEGVSEPVFRWQRLEFQQLLAMLQLDATDGPQGTNAEHVTAADLAAFEMMYMSSATSTHLDRHR